MNTTIRNYESLYVVNAGLTDEQLESVISKYTQLVTDGGGEVIAAGKWDRRRLAYEVKGQREGIYILMYFAAESAVSNELDRVMRISDDVIRHIILNVEPQHIDTSRLMKAQEEAAAEAEQPAQQEEAPAEAAPQEAGEPAAETETAEEAAPEEQAEQTEQKAENE